MQLKRPREVAAAATPRLPSPAPAMRLRRPRGTAAELSIAGHSSGRLTTQREKVPAAPKEDRSGRLDVAAAQGRSSYVVDPLRRVEHVQKGRKNRRARASHRLAQHGEAATAAELEEVGFLVANTVRPLTADQYRLRVNDFEKVCRCKASDVADLDGKLVEFLTHAYFSGATADEGSGVLGALK